MDQPVGHSMQLWLRARRRIWCLGAGWAAVAGGLASGALSSAAAQPLAPALTLLLVWFLADPLLGTVWDLGASPRGIWTQLQRPRGMGPTSPLVILPYTRPNSPAWRLAARMDRLRVVWQEAVWPQAGHAFIALLGALGMALAVGALLGRAAVALVVLSVALSWLAARVRGSSRQHSANGSQAGLATLCALGEFGIPWMIGCLAFSQLAIPAAALGISYTIAYAGLLERPVKIRPREQRAVAPCAVPCSSALRKGTGLTLALVGQLAALCLLVGLRQPLAAAAAAVFLVAQWWLHEHADEGGAWEPYLRAAQPFMLASLLVAALGVGL